MPRSVMTLLLLTALTLAASGCDKRSTEKGQAGGNVVTEATAPTSGEVPPSSGAPEKAIARVDRSHAGEDAPDFVFTGPDGKDVTLAQFRGTPLLVNLWATWCGPCVEEMPTIDALAGGDADLRVLAVSQDMGEAAEVQAFFAARRLKHLALYRDPENQLGFHYRTGMLPTTVLYDAAGKEVARVVGAMDWSGAEAAALIEEARR